MNVKYKFKKRIKKNKLSEDDPSKESTSESKMAKNANLKEKNLQIHLYICSAFARRRKKSKQVYIRKMKKDGIHKGKVFNRKPVRLKDCKNIYTLRSKHKNNKNVNNKRIEETVEADALKYVKSKDKNNRDRDKTQRCDSMMCVHVWLLCVKMKKPETGR